MCFDERFTLLRTPSELKSNFLLLLCAEISTTKLVCWQQRKKLRLQRIEISSLYFLEVSYSNAYENLCHGFVRLFCSWVLRTLCTIMMRRLCGSVASHVLKLLLRKSCLYFQPITCCICVCCVGELYDEFATQCSEVETALAVSQSTIISQLICDAEDRVERQCYVETLRAALDSDTAAQCGLECSVRFDAALNPDLSAECLDVQHEFFCFDSGKLQYVYF